MLKLAGSICVLAACIGFVRELLRTGSLHKKYLESLIELTELLAAEIRYERLPIQDALLQIQKKVKPEIAAVLRQIVTQMNEGKGTAFSEIWEQAFQKFGKELLLTGEELEEACRIGKHLGFLDQRQQEQHLQGCRERLMRLLKLRQKELEEKKHMYRCLGVAAGIFVILILV
ncbi:stage III sporulation protein AB [uncultured Eubacterium sp.]|uniref:stage III sporulation protein AB n=1 Tax=uncultured Eubacterium sp. TaxID=165185 RepID=UPI0025CEF60D|nr:stage III sporulation protein AB [uncultured Eubacterium sp.]MCI6536795.1 stage III sporulation protein AB [Lachnospiraceae bacterium]